MTRYERFVDGLLGFRGSAVTAGVPMSDPGVRFPPPMLFVGGALLGWILDRYWRAMPLSGVLGSAARPVGLVLLVSGVCFSLWGILTFKRAGTAIIPHHAATRIVRAGPYRITRNPMYTGLTVTYLGVAALLDSAWLLLVLPVVLALLIRLVITREEAYLSTAFGQEYEDYRSHVRRWL